MAGELAMVLSGGGAKGAFQVGVIHELVVNRGVRIDIVAGVSTGAIQALGTAQDDVPAMLQQWLYIRGNREGITTAELKGGVSAWPDPERSRNSLGAKAFYSSMGGLQQECVP